MLNCHDFHDESHKGWETKYEPCFLLKVCSCKNKDTFLGHNFFLEKFIVTMETKGPGWVFQQFISYPETETSDPETVTLRHIETCLTTVILLINDPIKRYRNDIKLTSRVWWIAYLIVTFCQFFFI